MTWSRSPSGCSSWLRGAAVCDRAQCRMCGHVKLGLTMAWRDGDGEDVEMGHVCYGCEDRVCNEIAAGRSSIRWIDTVEVCR